TVPGCYEDIDEADLLVLVGSNAAWCHPVTFQRMLANKQKRGARMVVIDPRRTDSAEDAELFLGVRPGTDTAPFSGLLAHLADHADRPAQCDGRPRGWRARQPACRPYGLYPARHRSRPPLLERAAHCHP